MSDLITRDQLAEYMGESIAADTHADADAAISDATAAISVFIRRDVTELPAGTPTYEVAAARGVAKRVAARILRNPDLRQTYTGPDGLNYTAGSGVAESILTGQEKANLAPLVAYDGIFG